jgi:branched-chain amino acid transport system ATP-binding protein
MLQVDGVDVFYGNLQAVWSVSLAVHDNEIVTLIGANGAGKSSVVKSIAGLLHPARGKIIFDGLQLDRLAPHKIAEAGITLVPEGRKVFSGMTALENLEMGAYLVRDKKDRDDRLGLVYELFPVLKNRARQKAETLSGGEQQMLAIGRGLMARPRLMLLDEISQGLAPIVVYSLFKTVEQIGRSGVSILLVEQNVSLALEVADRAYILEGGHITNHGNARALINDGQVKKAYLGTA